MSGDQQAGDAGQSYGAGLPVPFTAFGALVSERLTGSLAPMLGSWSAELSRSLALGISRSLDFSGLVSPGILSRLREMLPPNWDDLDGPDWEGALAAMNDGIPLIWVPRAAIASELMGAGDAASRRRILEQSAPDIMADCAAVLAEVTDPALAPLAALAAASARALGDGHCEAAQALAANVFDTWLRDVVRRSVLFPPPGSERSPYRHASGLIEPVTGEVTISELRESGSLAPVVMALAGFTPGGPVPEQFGRHATAHAASPEQYSDVNAVIAVMLTTSVLRQAQASGW